MKTNVAVKMDPLRTHEGAIAVRIGAELELRRSLMACMLFEDSFYESGVEIADRICSLIGEVEPQAVASMAVEARTKMKLRHAPLMVCREMLRHPEHRKLVAATLADVIQRADELAEFLAIYWRDAKLENGRIVTPLAAQAKRGLAKAFQKFNAYSLAKYNRDAAIKLRDVMFLVHPKPVNAEQAEVWKKLAAGTLESPDTWEVALSASKGENKKAIWERLLAEEKLGALALLRNLRNMKQANVDENLIITAITRMKTERVLPFRFIGAARYAPQWESHIEGKMFDCLAGTEKLVGKTVLVVDTSGSMENAVSSKSELSRMDAASALAILLREICEKFVVIRFSGIAEIVPARRGFALRDAIQNGEHSSTQTQLALDLARREGYDRIIVITDEQSHQSISGPLPNTKAYFVNVAAYQNGIGYGAWTHIDGFSEAVLSYIAASEQAQQ